ncbi:MAG: hypothetical protein HAW58_01850 [Candidatus Thioglobus sp.]|nr:hypothetical protein [Candidatus Thioglobus sp.]
MADFDEFKFDINSLKKPRKPGISGFMRIKNEAKFLRLSILSHIEFYDEIIAVYNDCNDATPEILQDLQKQFPDKIKIYHYLPKVHPTNSNGHSESPAESVHSLANYYNYAMSKTTFTIVTKLDADHLAIKENLAPMIAKIRAEMQQNKPTKYMFSGINLIENPAGKLVVNAQKTTNLFVGNGDHWYFPANENITFEQAPVWEVLNFSGVNLKSEYLGIMYFHLKFLKDNFGFENQDEAIKRKFIKKILETVNYVEFDVFRSKKFINNLKKNSISQKNPLKNSIRKFILNRNKAFFNLVMKLLRIKRYNLQLIRLITLRQDLKNIDFPAYAEKIKSC